jgi:hypothetical protein
LRLRQKNDEEEEEMTTSWDGVVDSLLLEPQYRVYKSNAIRERERLAFQLGLTLEEYDEKLHWGFSEFYD